MSSKKNVSTYGKGLDAGGFDHARGEFGLFCCNSPPVGVAQRYQLFVGDEAVLPAVFSASWTVRCMLANAYTTYLVLDLTHKTLQARLVFLY